MDAARGQGQAGHLRNVPLHAEVGVDYGRPGAAVAIEAALAGPGQFAVQQHGPAQQANAVQRRAEEVQLQALVALLAIGLEVVVLVEDVGRTLDAEQAEGGGEMAQVILGAHLDLLAAIRREHLVRVVRRAGRGLALGQPFHVVEVERHPIAGPHHQAHGRRSRAFVVVLVGRARSRAVHLDPLQARAQGEQHQVIAEAEGIGQGQAGEDGLGVGRHIQPGRLAGYRQLQRIEQVADAIGEACAAVVELHVEAVQAEVQGVPHRAGGEPAARTGRPGQYVFVPLEGPWADGETAAVIHHLHRVPQEVVFAVALAGCGIDHQRFVQVQFAAQGAEAVLGIGVCPGLREVVVDVLGVGHLDARVQPYPLHRRVHVPFLVGEVQGQAGTLTTVVQAKHGGLPLQPLVVPLRVAGLAGAIEAHAKTLVIAEASADVDMTTGLAVGDEAAGDFGQRLVASALGLDVDAAADAAIGRDAAEQSARPLEDIHPLDHFHVDGIGRQHAIETAEGHITVIEAETTHGELLETATGGVGVTHGRVVGHHVGQGPRLLVLDQLTGVGGDVEGRFHEIPVTQQAKAAAARHLAAVIGLAAQAHAHATADDGDLRQLGQFAALFRLQLQGIGARPGCAQAQATALQQSGKAFFHSVLTL
ncbi:hypothetical protein D3C84_229800 [compost metagenome]